ncbi:phospholipase-like protein, partial [Tanacetum coccineum]
VPHVLVTCRSAENRRNVPKWLLRIANDRVSWNKYLWGSYVWPTLYSQLRNPTIRRWGPLYVDQPTNEDDRTTYSIFGYIWAFSRYPRVAALRKKKGRFTSEMVFGFFQGNIPVARLTPDDIEARSDWWISSKAYFDGFIDQVERVPFDLSRHNMYEIPSGVYRQFVEQKIELERNKKDVHDIKEEMQKFREEMDARSVRQENTVPIIVGQHYGLSDFSEFRTMQRWFHIRFMDYGYCHKFQQFQCGPNTVVHLIAKTDAEAVASHYWRQGDEKKEEEQGSRERTDMQSLSYGIPIGWLSGEHMNSWMEQLIRRRPLNANWTVAYTSTISVHPENNQFIIVNDPHVIGTLDGSTRPYPSWNDVDWVFLPIHVAGNHWATGVIDLANKARNTK